MSKKELSKEDLKNLSHDDLIILGASLLVKHVADSLEKMRRRFKMIPKYRMWNEIISKLCSVDGLYFDREVAQYKDEVGVSRFIKFENTILMQSTGLFDKNGQEIFEGDIVSDGFDIGDIKSHKTLGFYMVDKKGVERWFSDGATIEGFEEYVKTAFKIIEVIGNIYENPEFLEADYDRN